MNVLELLSHYRLEKLDEKDYELFTYFGYSYSIENDENNHPSFYVKLFSKATRVAVITFSISYKGALMYSCNICREKQPCRHFSILVTKLLDEEYEQVKAMSERFSFEISESLAHVYFLRFVVDFYFQTQKNRAGQSRVSAQASFEHPFRDGLHKMFPVLGILKVI